MAQFCIKGLLVVRDFCSCAVWAALSVLKKNWADFEQLLRVVFSCFQGQKMRLQMQDWVFRLGVLLQFYPKLHNIEPFCSTVYFQCTYKGGVLNLESPAISTSLSAKILLCVEFWCRKRLRKAKQWNSFIQSLVRPPGSQKQGLRNRGFRGEPFFPTLVTQPMLQCRPNRTELRSMDSYIQILCRFHKSKQKVPPPLLLDNEKSSFRG